MGKFLEIQVIDSANKFIYSNDYTPKIYQRTHRIDRGVKSNTSEENGEILLEVYIDDNIVKSNHIDKYQSKGKTEPYAEIIELGHDKHSHGYDFPTDGRFTSPRPFMEKMLEENKDEIINFIGKSLENILK